MTNLKTPQSTLNALEQAVRHRPSKDELDKQRVSFIMGSLNSDSTVTREKVERLLADQLRRSSNP